MNWLTLFLVLGLVTVNLVHGEESESIEELPLAEACNVTTCQLPNCRCSGTDIPGGLAARDTPQFVLLTFDDGINILNIETYRRAIYARRNSNNCPIGVTFYVSHEYTNYELVNELHQQGFEIALHSITHQIPQSYWADASLEDIVREFADQKKQMNEFANIPSEDLQGMRIPFLQMNGNNSFQMMSEHGLLYDSTWGTINSINPGLWPYTLDYASTQECLVPPCPTASIPGVWELPMVSWLDLAGSACSMVDSCFNVPDMDDEEAWFHFIVSNFERHYLGNRAPFGFFVHEWYVSSNPVVERALIRFMDMINKMHDVFMVNSKDVIDWVKNPIPVNEYRYQDCRLVAPTVCDATACGPLTADHTNNDYWMTVCGSCPNVYPWIGNPLGL